MANGDVKMADAPAAQVGAASCAPPAHCQQCYKAHGLGTRHARSVALEQAASA